MIGPVATLDLLGHALAFFANMRNGAYKRGYTLQKRSFLKDPVRTNNVELTRTTKYVNASSLSCEVIFLLVELGIKKLYLGNVKNIVAPLRYRGWPFTKYNSSFS